MDDTALVIDVLMNLKQASLAPSLPPPPPPPSPPQQNSPTPPPGWTIRQRRSRPRMIPSPAANKSRAVLAIATDSLSYSGATSASGGGIAKESSRRTPNLYDVSESKAMPSSGKTPTKRRRKKKFSMKDESKGNKALKKELALKPQSQGEGEGLEVVASGETLETVSAPKEVGHEANKKLDDGDNEGDGDGFLIPDLNIPATMI